MRDRYALTRKPFKINEQSLETKDRNALPLLEAKRPRSLQKPNVVAHGSGQLSMWFGGLSIPELGTVCHKFDQQP
jgi:hypothetical protein